MKQVHSAGDFEALLRAERAVVFIFFRWSARAAASQKVFEYWQAEAARDASFAVYELTPDDLPFTWQWLNGILPSRDGESAGEGAVIWLNQGELAGFVPDAAWAGMKTLNRITRDCFVLGKTLPPGAMAGDMAPFDAELLKILCCPETHQELKMAATPVLDHLNQQIIAGRINNRAGQPVTEIVAGGLVRADGRFLYPLRQNIPVLLVDEAIPWPLRAAQKIL